MDDWSSRAYAVASTMNLGDRSTHCCPSSGILYISTDDGTQWRSLIASWLKALERPEAVVNKLRECFDTYCDKTLFWMKISVKPVLPIVDMNMIQVGQLLSQWAAMAT
jgi:hypothetical protein